MCSPECPPFVIVHIAPCHVYRASPRPSHPIPRSDDDFVGYILRRCIGNIAADGPDMRDRMLSTPNLLNDLLVNFRKPATVSLLRNAAWALSNLARGTPRPLLHSIAPMMPALAQATTLVQDDEAVASVCLALSYVTR